MMRKQSFQVPDTLPTIARAYRPLEEYLEALHEANNVEIPVPVAPIDALLVNLLVSMCSGHPILVDLAGDATHGGSTVLCCTQSKAHKVIRQQPSSQDASSWFRVVTSYLNQYATHNLIAPQEVASGDLSLATLQPFDLFSEGAPTMVVMAALGETPAILADKARGWLEQGPNVFIFVLGLGETGQCEYVNSLSTAFNREASQRFVLPRERAAALHASTLGLLYQRAHPYLDHVLARLAALFTGNFSFPSLVKQACEAALRTAAVDNSILEAHPFGPLAGTRRRIVELEHSLVACEQALAVRDQTLAARDEALAAREQALAVRDQTLAEVRWRNSELEAAVAQRNEDLLRIIGSRAYRMAGRIRELRTFVAPDGSFRLRVLRKTLRVIQVCKAEGLKGLLSRILRR